MGVKYDFSDVPQFFRDAVQEVVAFEDTVGREAIAYAKQHGTYHDRSGHLRHSNYYNATEHGLEIGNSASYASEVEARGNEVVTGAVLYAERRLRGVE